MEEVEGGKVETQRRWKKEGRRHSEEVEGEMTGTHSGGGRRESKKTKEVECVKVE